MKLSVTLALAAIYQGCSCGCGGSAAISTDAGFRVTHEMICSVKPGWGAAQTTALLGEPCSGGLSNAPPFAVYGRWGVPDCSSSEMWQVNYDEPPGWEVVQVSGAPDPCEVDGTRPGN